MVIDRKDRMMVMTDDRDDDSRFRCDGDRTLILKNHNARIPSSEKRKIWMNRSNSRLPLSLLVASCRSLGGCNLLSSPLLGWPFEISLEIPFFGYSCDSPPPFFPSFSLFGSSSLHTLQSLSFYRCSVPVAGKGGKRKGRDGRKIMRRKKAKAVCKAIWWYSLFLIQQQ